MVYNFALFRLIKIVLITAFHSEKNPTNIVKHQGKSMTRSNDTEEKITTEIHQTLERSKLLRDKNPAGSITADHFHSYEYLISLLGRRQALSNRSLEKLTVRIFVLTIAVIVIGLFQIALYLLI